MVDVYSHVCIGRNTLGINRTHHSPLHGNSKAHLFRTAVSIRHVRRMDLIHYSRENAHLILC